MTIGDIKFILNNFLDSVKRDRIVEKLLDSNCKNVTRPQIVSSKNEWTKR